MNIYICIYIYTYMNMDEWAKMALAVDNATEVN
jgi:hypothetical protein